ncbi:MAG: protein-glutamate O-methyltransferase CheR [Myxococcaceae bacterium]|nr:protein-glutamate O-methyltransferase CheR [Myxococcaceae bacterium]
MTATPAPQSRVLTLLSALVEEHCGLKLDTSEGSAFGDRVWARAVEAGYESLLDYYYFLRYDAAAPGELKRLIDELVINETYFFRELEPLRVAVDQLLAARVAENGRARIWSAACSTGEEPTTVAMLVAQAGLTDTVDIIASDVSERALARARKGDWSRRALREVPSPALASRWLQEDEQGRPRLRSELLSTIDFRRVNLTKPDEVAAVGPCDVILCRNVLIYFSDETAAKVVANLTGNLAPRGALFVGVSESLLRLGTGLECEELDRCFFYRAAGT